MNELELDFIKHMLPLFINQAYELGYDKARRGYLMSDEHMKYCQLHIDELVKSAISTIELNVNNLTHNGEQDD